MAVGDQKTCPKCGNVLPGSAVFCERCGARVFRDKGGHEASDPYLGKLIDGTFAVESILGTGSMGIVYKAWHRVLKCHVALKVLRQDFITDRLILQRFQREAEAANKLSHPNVIRVLHFGRTELKAPYIVMECLDGIELAQLVPQEFPLSQRRVCILAIQTARALRAAHAANIIHRDLKPANIVIVQQNGEEIVKVLDFGIAKIAEGGGEGLTREGAICGTPAFMSPEQIAGKKVTPATDIFSFGSILYFMLTCKLPFQGTELLELASTILNDEPIPPSRARLDTYVDPNLEAICLKALQKDIGKRFQTSAELVDALENVLPQIPFVNPAVRQQIVVGSARGVNPNAKTCCELPVVPGDGDETTVFPAAADTDMGETDSNNEVTVASPYPRRSQPNSAYPSAPGFSAQGMSAPRSAGGAPAVVVPNRPLRASNSYEKLERRKKLFFVIVCTVIVICIMALIGIIVMKKVKKDAAHRDPVAEINVEEISADAEAGQLSAAERERIRLDADIASIIMRDAAIRNIAYGLTDDICQITDCKKSAGGTPEDLPQDNDAAIDNKVADSVSAGENPPQKKESAAPKVSNKKSESAKSTKSRLSDLLTKAANLVSAGKLPQACAIYAELEKTYKNKEISSSERSQLNIGLRKCNRN